MILLTRIILVQWYRIDAEDIPIVGHTVIVGDNGAGKSAILDAVQTVLTGANKNRMVLNRGSNEQSSRKLWEYVLGVLSDPKNPDTEEDIRPREKANCYLALNFYNQESQETTCVGMGISASLEEMDDRLEGLFVAPGLIGSKTLFLESQEDQPVRVLPWARAKERLERACPRIRFHKASGKFTQDLYTHLSEVPATPNDSETVLKALRAAFRLEKISDPSEFIREYMLDREDLQIQELHTELQRYRYIAEKTAMVSTRIEELTALEDVCAKIEEARVKKVLSEWVSLNALLEESEDRANPLREELGDLDIHCDEMEQEKNRLTHEKDELSTIKGEKNAELKNLDINVRRDRAKLDKERAEQQEKEASQKLFEVRRIIEGLMSVQEVPATEQVSQAIGDLVGCLPKDDLLSRETWPENPDRVDVFLNGLRDSLDIAKPIIEKRYDQFCVSAERMTAREKELTGTILQLKNNITPLGHHSRGLIRDLEEKGITTEPLCDLVEEVDLQWRDTIEGVLGNLREALVVDPCQAKDAVKFYRTEGRREFPGCHLINTTQTDRWLDRQQQNSLASCLTAKDPHARAFLNRRLGNIICVESEKDLLSHDRAATTDGMLSSGGTVTEIRKVPPILGLESREEFLQRTEKELGELSKEIGENNTRKTNQGKLNALLDRFQDRFPAGISMPVSKWTTARGRAFEEIRKCDEELARLSRDGRKDELMAVINDLEKKIKAAGKQIEALEGQRNQEGKRIVEIQGILTNIERDLDGWETSLSVLRSNPLLDSAKAADILNRWRESLGGDLNAIHARAARDCDTAGETIRSNEKQLQIGYAEYHIQHLGEEGPDENPPEKFEDYAVLIRGKRAQLVDTTLADYKAKSARALQGAEDAFRAQFVSRLIERLDAVKRQIFDLNKILERNPFHGEETYKFKSESNPEFKHIIDLAEAVGKSGAGEIGGLFDPGTDPSSPHRKALNDIAAALQNPKEAERLQDYRNYLIFQVKIHNRDGKEINSLDARIKKGSGGENQTPFYVAIGSSLSAAYRIRQGIGSNVRGGMSLAVFDEAFSKLSFSTCQRCAGFLMNIHLQLLAAAPDEKFTTMAEVMDQVIWVTRDGGTVDISVLKIKHAMREKLRSDNPYAQSIGEIPEHDIE